MCKIGVFIRYLIAKVIKVQYCILQKMLWRPVEL